MQPQFLTPAELAERWRLQPSTIQSRIKRQQWDQLPTITPTGTGPKARKRFALKHVIRFEESLEMGRAS